MSEGAIWSGVDANVIFCFTLDGVIKAHDVVTGAWQTIAELGETLWQMSKSDDDQTFAFTWRTPEYENLGWIVYDRSTGTVTKKRTDTIDEAQLDKTGRYLVYKTGQQGADVIEVIIVDLMTGGETPIEDDEPGFAPGHSDNGRATVYGEDNWENRVLERNLATPDAFETVYNVPNWNRAGHVSARADDESRILVSLFGATTGPLASEIFQVSTDGTGTIRHLVHHHSWCGCTRTRRAR